MGHGARYERAMMITHRQIWGGLLALALLVTGCASQGLVTEQYDPSLYEVDAQFETPDSIGTQPTFLVYGDTQAGWRVRHTFLDGDNWRSWKMALLPLYPLYLLGEGAVGGLNWYRQQPDYGGDRRAVVRDAVHDAIQQESPDFVLNVGDIATADGRRPDHWETFLTENRTDPLVLGTVPYLPTPGNHDRTTDSTYGLPNYRSIFERDPFYVVDFPDGALVVLDSNLIIEWKQEIANRRQDALFRRWFVSDEDAPPAWLERVLASRADRSHLIVSMHHTPVNFGPHADQWDRPEKYGSRRSRQWELLRVFQQYGVDVVFSGHEHIYQHSVLRYARGGQSRTMHFVTTSGGGAPLRELSTQRKVARLRATYQRAGFDAELVRQAQTHHYTRVDVKPTEMQIHTVTVPLNPALPEQPLETITIPADPEEAVASP